LDDQHYSTAGPEPQGSNAGREHFQGHLIITRHPTQKPGSPPRKSRVGWLTTAPSPDRYRLGGLGG